MIRSTTKVEVTGLSSKDVYDFLLTCTDTQYQHWWPGTHLVFHTIKRTPSNVGNLVYMDEYLSDFRLQFHGVVKEARRMASNGSRDTAMDVGLSFSSFLVLEEV